jgi:putative transposase
VNAVADSDGHLVVNPKYHAAAMKRLARAQRNVSRKKKGSKNREKAKVRVMRLHRKVRRQREHFVHGLSATYSKSHGTVVVEKLQIGNMTRSAKGTVATPGKGVAQKAGLNRGILDSGWGMLASQLRYKMAWSGGQVIEVPAAYSSQTCSACGCVDGASRRTQSDFVCTSCGHTEHADLNAAKVLLTRANRSGLPGEGSPLGTLGTRKVLRVARRSAQSSGL